MKFNFTPRNIAIAILLILTLILGIVSIVIATRLGQPATISVDSHGCQDYPPKNESWCDATNQCQGSDKPCTTTPPPGNTCQTNFGGGCVTRSAGCTSGVSCTRYGGANDSPYCNSGGSAFTLNPGQTVCASPSCKSCEQIDCDGGGVRQNNDNACVTPPNPPPPPPLVCGDAKCKTGEVCEKATAGGTTYKLCTAANITAGTAPTGAAAPTCIATSCTLTPVVLVCGDGLCKTGEACERTAAGATTYKSCTAADITAGTAPTGAASDCNINSCSVNVVNPPPVSVPLPSTAVISDDFDRVFAGIALVILGLLAYRFNLIGKLFVNSSGLPEEDAIRNSPLSRLLKSRRGNFEKKVEENLKKDK